MIVEIIFGIIALLIFAPFIIGTVLLARFVVNKSRPTQATTNLFQQYAATNNYPYTPKVDKQFVVGDILSAGSLLVQVGNYTQISTTNASISLLTLGFMGQRVGSADADGGRLVNEPVSLTVVQIQTPKKFSPVFLAPPYFSQFPLVPSQYTEQDVAELEGVEFGAAFKCFTKVKDVSIQELLPPNIMVQLIDNFKSIAVEFKGQSVIFYQPATINSASELQSLITKTLALVAKL